MIEMGDDYTEEDFRDIEKKYPVESKPEIPKHHISYSEFNGLTLMQGFEKVTRKFNDQADVLEDMKTALEYLSIELRAVQRAQKQESEKVYI